MNHMTNSLSSADISIFSSEISKFYYIKNTNIFFDFFWVFKDLLIKHEYNFDNVNKIGYSSPF